MVFKPWALVPVIMFCLMACTAQDPTAGQRQPVSAPKPPIAQTPAAPDDVLLSRIGGLDRQALEDGECGLFLWAALPERQLVFFQRARDVGAQMHLDNSVQTLIRTRAEGDQIYSIFPDQSFRAGDLTITLSLATEGLQPVTKGSMVRQASLRLDDPDGWTIVLPVAGLVACQ